MRFLLEVPYILSNTLQNTLTPHHAPRRWQSLTEFSERHKGHVARLWAEAQELVSDMEAVQGDYYRAKDTYEQACIQATRLIDDRNKARDSAASAARAAAEEAPEAAIGNVHPPFTPPSPSRTKEVSLE